MNHIGNIIKEYRCKVGISQKELAEGICSPKYIYYIEKGDRTPSTDLLRFISDRLNVDLCSLYRFLDCANPVEVYESIVLFEKYRRNSDFLNLKNLTEQVRRKPDFIKAPWIYEIKINDFCHMVLVEGKVEKAIDGLKTLINSLANTSYSDYYIVQMNMLLSICYQMLCDLDNCYKIIDETMDLVKGKSNMFQYRQVIITAKISLLFLFVKMKQFDGAIDEGLQLLEYQLENDQYERLHYTYFLLAMAYYQSSTMETAVEYCKKAIYIAIVYKRSYDVGVFFVYDSFIELINNSSIDRGLVLEFCNIYGIDIKQHEIRI